MKEKIGEPINLIWDGKPDAYYVKGHVDKDEAIDTICDYEGFPLLVCDMVADHIYAKWCKATEDDMVDGCDFSFRTRHVARAGWFKVTEVRLKKDAAKEANADD